MFIGRLVSSTSQMPERTSKQAMTAYFYILFKFVINRHHINRCYKAISLKAASLNKVESSVIASNIVNTLISTKLGTANLRSATCHICQSALPRQKDANFVLDAAPLTANPTVPKTLHSPIRDSRVPFVLRLTIFVAGTGDVRGGCVAPTPIGGGGGGGGAEDDEDDEGPGITTGVAGFELV
jgi:hypothetical protein